MEHRRARAQSPAPTSLLVWRHSPKLDHFARPANGQKRLSPVGIALNRLQALVSAAARHPWRRRVIEALQRLEQMPPSAWDGSGHRLKQTQDRFDDGIKVQVIPNLAEMPI